MQSTLLLPLAAGLPTFKEALDSLDDVPNILWRALEHAASKTCAWRDQNCPKKQIDVGLSATMFRFHAIDYLRKQGLDAHEDGCHWTFNSIPFLGISFYYKQKHIRILKGAGGCLPGCGKSRVKKKFFNQVPKPYLVGNVPTWPTANLVVLWDFDYEYALKQLWLTLPATGADRQQDVRAFWCEAIPHPAESAGSVPVAIATAPTSSSDDGLEALIQSSIEELVEETEGS